MTEIKTAIGLMSGTSMDGIDLALLRTDGRDWAERGPSMGIAYDPAFRNSLKQALEDAKEITERTQRPRNLSAIERELTLRHAKAIGIFLNDNGILPGDVDVVGFHGQTVLHRPEQALTVQLGDGALLAREAGIAVVYDMRANDMVHGGQGAPLIPVYHACLASTLADNAEVRSPLTFVNIGGISNLTFIGTDGGIVAYDSGPGNALIDQWVEAHAGIPYDQGGMIASEGGVLPQLADRYLSNPFFTTPKRRSLDRNDFLPPEGREASLEDGARTLAHVTAAAILKSAGHLPDRPKSFVISGGGRLNRIIMDDLSALAAEQGAVAIPAEAVGLNGDTMEAEAWAYLAVRSLAGLPLTFPATTGVRQPVSGGVFAAPGSLQAADSVPSG